MDFFEIIRKIETEEANKFFANSIFQNDNLKSNENEDPIKQKNKKRKKEWAN